MCIALLLIFHSTLLENGCDTVTRWTSNKVLIFFQKTYIFVFVPVNLSSDWSLLAFSTAIMPKILQLDNGGEF